MCLAMQGRQMRADCCVRKIRHVTTAQFCEEDMRATTRACDASVQEIQLCCLWPKDKAVWLLCSLLCVIP